MAAAWELIHEKLSAFYGDWEVKSAVLFHWRPKAAVKHEFKIQWPFISQLWCFISGESLVSRIFSRSVPSLCLQRRTNLAHFTERHFPIYFKNAPRGKQASQAGKPTHGWLSRVSNPQSLLPIVCSRCTLSAPMLSLLWNCSTKCLSEIASLGTRWFLDIQLLGKWG